MNNDLISRDKLLEAFRDFKDMDCPSGHTVTADYMIELAEDAPAVDAAPVRRGRWIIETEFHDSAQEDGWWEDWSARCSECGEVIYLDGWLCEDLKFKKALEKFIYCSVCGAKNEEYEYEDNSSARCSV